jgi:hypothetical protein
LVVSGIGGDDAPGVEETPIIAHLQPSEAPVSLDLGDGARAELDGRADLVLDADACLDPGFTAKLREDPVHPVELGRVESDE